MSINISDFYRNEVCDYASYDNFRKLSNVCDGLKNSSRKCIYTILKNNINSPKKVSQLKSDAASQTQYLHGDQSLEGVLVGLAQNFVGSNNIPLLKREGSFGNRLVPVAAAGRYIFTCKEDYLDKLFRKEDEKILIEQNFEGDIIEPQFYIPILPLLVINGGIGLTTGFSQKILPRNPKDIIEYIENKLNDKKSNIALIPWFNGFTGDIEENQLKGQGSWIIKGKYKITSSNTIEITEIPYDYTLESYTEILDKLEENKDIKEYKDLSDEGKFHFIIKLSRIGQGFSVNDKDLLSKLKLVELVTENYTSFDENNKVAEYKSIYEIIDHYYDIRLKYYDKRKEWLISELTKKLVESVSKYIFINGVIENKIVLSKKTDKEIENQLMSFDKIIKINNSYDYLINMPLRSLTKTQLTKLTETINNLKAELNTVKSTTNIDMWKKDLEEFKLVYFK